MKTNYEPKLETRVERPYVSIRAQVTLKEWSKANALVSEVFAWLEKKKIAPAGAPFFRYWIIGDEDQRFQLEVGVPLDRLHRGDGRIQAGTMPKGTALPLFTGDIPTSCMRLMPRWKNGARRRA